MRQVTGRTNPQKDLQKVSIRIFSDGHSFPDREISALSEPSRAKIELVSPRTTLVPASEFNPDLATEYLTLSGLQPLDSESVVWSATTSPCIAVMAISRELLKSLPEGCEFSSPLQAEYRPAMESVTLELIEKILYIKVYQHTTLNWAEVVRCETENDALYYISRLAEHFPLKKLQLRALGTETKSLIKRVKSHFKNCVCE